MSVAELPQKVSLDAEMAEVGRELAMRRRVYPGLVATGKMTQHQADWQMRCMESVLARLRRAKQKGEQ